MCSLVVMENLRALSSYNTHFSSSYYTHFSSYYYTDLDQFDVFLGGDGELESLKMRAGKASRVLSKRLPNVGRRHAIACNVCSNVCSNVCCNVCSNVNIHILCPLQTLAECWTSACYYVTVTYKHTHEHTYKAACRILEVGRLLCVT